MAFCVGMEPTPYFFAAIAAVLYLEAGLLLLVWLTAACRWDAVKRVVAGLVGVLAIAPLLSSALYSVRGTLLTPELLAEGVSLVAKDRTAWGGGILVLLAAWGLLAAWLAAAVLRGVGRSPDAVGIQRGKPAAVALGALALAFGAFGASSVLVWVAPAQAPAFRSDVHAVSSLAPRGWLAHATLVPADRRTRPDHITERAPGLPLSALAAYLSGLERAGPGLRPNVVVVMLEGVPVQHVGAYGYERSVTPEIDAIAGRSVVFENVYSITNESKNGQTAILASVLPMRGRMNNFVSGPLDFPRVLAWDVFRALGYRTAFISTQDERWLGMSRFQLHLKVPPDVYLHAPDFTGGELIPGGFPNRDEETVNREVLRFLERASHDDRPFLLIVNYQRTHFPYRLPSWRSPRFRPLAPLGDAIRAWTPTDLPQAVNNFDSALAYVDEQVGVLARKLDALGIADRTLLSVISDHGQGFEVGFQPVSQSLEDEYVHIPWLMRLPGGLEPQRVATPASAIDLFPTILGAIGAPPCPAWQGIDVLSPEAVTAPSRPILVGSIVWEARWRALVGELEIDVDLLGRRWEPRRRGSLRKGGAPPPAVPRPEAILEWVLSTIRTVEGYYEDAEARRTLLPPSVPPSPR